jgi:L-alanine-DL-glutamate epimerase-like enolase superfamily enzyme
MSRIERIELCMVNLAPEIKRTDAIQCFASQETPILKIYDSDGLEGVGYSYTIGSGGSSIMRLLIDHLLPQLIGRDPSEIESIWKDLYYSTHATNVGAITSLALAAIDTALWDLKCRKAGSPLYLVAGGAKDNVQMYTTEGGWLHLSKEELVEDALKAKEDGFCGAKIKTGKPHVSEDVARLSALREAVGDDWEIMVDCNQAFTVDEAIRRARHFETYDLAWMEEPLRADDLNGHIRLSKNTALPIAVGESMYSVLHFREYMQQQATSIIQVDVARIGGITPWLKVAHTAEAFNLPVCPHFLMELHVSLACAIPNGRWVEYIPQLQGLTTEPMKIVDGYAYAPTTPGLGISWDWDAINAQKLIDYDVYLN